MVAQMGGDMKELIVFGCLAPVLTLQGEVVRVFRSPLIRWRRVGRGRRSG